MTSLLRKDSVSLLTGIVLCCLGSLVYFYWNDVFEGIVYKRFVLTEKSKTYEPWKKSKLPLVISYYFFNWTNPSDLKDPDYKPQFEEIGPYRFWEKMEKINIVWNENGTVSYNRMRRWYFDPDTSNGTLDDVITSINVVAVSATHIIRNWDFFTKMSLSAFFSTTNEGLVISKKVREYLFEGYDDPLLAAGSKVPFLSQKIPFQKFGWFFEKNGSSTSDGLYNIETGASGMESFGAMRKWNNKNHTGFYPGECGRVNGSGGDFWPPKRTKTESVAIFASDLCRFISFNYAEETSILGLKGYRYESGEHLLDNGTLNKDNECFCNGECVPNGALNVSTCRMGAPAFVSYPHFYLADKSYSDAVGGMNPDAEKHKTYIVIEPNFGVPLEVAARLQVNLLVQPDSQITLFRGVQRVFFPILWFEQKVTVLEETISPIKVLVLMPTAGLIASVIMIIGGVIAISIACYYKIFIKNRRTLTINITINSKVEKDTTNNGLSSNSVTFTKIKSEPKADIKTNGDKIVTNDTHF